LTSSKWFSSDSFDSSDHALARIADDSHAEGEGEGEGDGEGDADAGQLTPCGDSDVAYMISLLLPARHIKSVEPACPTVPGEPCMPLLLLGLVWHMGELGLRYEGEVAVAQRAAARALSLVGGDCVGADGAFVSADEGTDEGTSSKRPRFVSAKTAPVLLGTDSPNNALPRVHLRMSPLLPSAPLFSGVEDSDVEDNDATAPDGTGLCSTSTR